MGEREKIVSENDAKRAAMDKKVRAANRWYVGQRLLDLLFALLITGCVLVGYYRHVFLAVVLLAIVLTFGWRRWQHWKSGPINGHSDVWEVEDSATEHWDDSARSGSDDSSDSSDSGGD